MRVTLVHNPGSGRQSDAAKLAELLKDAGHEVREHSAKDETWGEVFDWPADVVAVAGGDGTVARVARHMLGSSTPIAPLPSGTANNISRSLGLVERPFEQLVAAWPEARRVKLDIGLAKGPWGERYFVEGVGAGLFACLLSAPSPERKHIGQLPADRRVAAALELLKKEAERCAPLDLAISLDGRELRGRYLLLEAVNIPYVGPNLFLAPDKKLGDGKLEVVLVTEAERERLKNYLHSWQANRERLAVLPSHRCERLRMEWTGFAVHVDDDLWPGTERAVPEHGTIDLTIAGQVEFLAPDPKRS